MGEGVIKPLISFKGRPLIAWVIDAVKGCREIKRIYIALTPGTVEVGRAVSREVVITEGKGFVEDLVQSFEKLSLDKTMVLPADLPLITPEDLEWVLAEYKRVETPSLAVYAPVSLFNELEIDPSLNQDGLVPTGVNILDGSNLDGEEAIIVSSNPRFAFNINTPKDLKKALGPLS